MSVAAVSAKEGREVGCRHGRCTTPLPATLPLFAKYILTEPGMDLANTTLPHADLTFRIVDFPKGEFLDNMHAVAKRIGFQLEAAANG